MSDIPPQFHPETITPAVFEAEVLKAKIPVLADFYADWCHTCKSIPPLLMEINQEFNPNAKAVKVDLTRTETDEAVKKLADTYHILSLPTLILFRDGKILCRREGYIMGADWKTDIYKAIHYLPISARKKSK